MKLAKNDIIENDDDDEDDAYTRSASADEKGMERTPIKTYLRFLDIGTFLMTSTQ